MKIKIAFLLFILYLFCPIIIKADLYNFDGSLNVSFVQFNDTELECKQLNLKISNVILLILIGVQDFNTFSTFTYFFEKKVMTSFESTYCSSMQQTYQGSSHTHVKNFFGTILQEFLVHRCNPVNCTIYKYWNETNMNSMPLYNFFNYLSEMMYLQIPFFLFLFVFIFFFGTLNCMYLNCCYCCCYNYSTVRKKPSFFTKMMVFMILSSVVFVAGGIMEETHFETLNTYFKQIRCQLISNNVYQVLTGINITTPDNKNSPDGSINWSGLNYLNTTFVDYIDDLINIRLILMKNSTYLRSDDPVQSSYENLQIGIQNFKNFQLKNQYSLTDPVGSLNPLFNITYICTICRDPLLINEANKEINNTLVLMQNALNLYREKVYGDFLNEKGWFSMYLKHNTSLYNIRTSMYKTYKFYNIVAENFDTFETQFNQLKFFEFCLFILNCFFTLLGAAAFKIVAKSIDDNNKIKEIMNYKGAAERERIKVKGRWAFHLSINSNTCSSIFLGGYSFILVLLAIFTYETTMVMENKFFDGYHFSNFTFIPNGDLIDLCIRPNIGGHVNDFFNFTYYYNYYTYMMDYTMEIKANYTRVPGTAKYDSYTSFVQNMDLSNFHSKDDKEFKWDPNGEQINYFLFPLTEYKYLKTPPKEVVREYTDFSFVPPKDTNYVNRQALYCTNFTSMDVWTDNPVTCTREFTNSPVQSTISPIKYPNLYCFTFSMDLILATPCPDFLIPNCYLTYFTSRYTSDNDFINCRVPQTVLTTNFKATTKDYFVDKISGLMTLAKYEDINRKQMQDYLDVFKLNYETMVNQNYKNYVKALKDAYNFYINLYPNFEQLRKWLIKYENSEFIGLSLDKFGLMKNSNCSFVRNTTKVFHFSKALMATQFFGSSIIFMTCTIFIFINFTLLIVGLLKLRSDKELGDLRDLVNTIKTIEEKERKYFFKPNVFIETDDAKMMGLDEEESKESDLLELKPNQQKNNVNKNKKSLYSKFVQRNSKIRINELNKGKMEVNDKNFAVLNKFFDNQVNDYDQRVNDEKANKVEEEEEV